MKNTPKRIRYKGQAYQLAEKLESSQQDYALRIVKRLQSAQSVAENDLGDTELSDKILKLITDIYQDYDLDPYDN